MLSRDGVCMMITCQACDDMHMLSLGEIIDVLTLGERGRAIAENYRRQACNCGKINWRMSIKFSVEGETGEARESRSVFPTPGVIAGVH